MISVTVVIPNYNGMKYVEGCLNALYQQEEGTPEFQVLVVDNGSSDGSDAVIEGKFPRARLIRLKENTGFCHAVNLGIQEADSPYVILLNNDTKVEPGFVKALFHAICQEENCFSVSAKMLMWDRPELVDDAGDRYCALGWAYSRGKGRPAADYNKRVEIFASCAGAAIYRKSVLEKIGYFDENHFAYLEDIDIGYRARIYGYRSYYEPKAEALHYGSASTGSRYNPRKTTLASANSVYLIAKNMPLLQQLVNLPFFLFGFLAKTLFFCKKGMGILYVKGLCKGIKLSLSSDGREKKVPFRTENLGSYLSIQWQLYINLFRIIMKT